MSGTGAAIGIAVRAIGTGGVGPGGSRDVHEEQGGSLEVRVGEVHMAEIDEHQLGL